MYLVQGEDKDNPFDLKPMIEFSKPNEGVKRKHDAHELQGEKYWTLSKKGITTYVNGKPDDYETL